MFDTVEELDRLLPLLRSIVSSAARHAERIREIVAKDAHLDTPGPDFAEYCELIEALGDEMKEVEDLGGDLYCPNRGIVHFPAPTLRSGRTRVFCWWPGEHAFDHWHFADESCIEEHSHERGSEAAAEGPADSLVDLRPGNPVL